MNQKFAKVCAGAVAGLVATAPISLVMLWWYRKGIWIDLDPLPPRHITKGALEYVRLEDELSNEAEKALTLLNHFGYGTTMGAVYGLVSPRHSTVGATMTGILYGLSVWSASYLGWLPAAGLYRSATDDSAERNRLMLAAHIVWGGTLGCVTEMAKRRMLNHNSCNHDSPNDRARSEVRSEDRFPASCA